MKAGSNSTRRVRTASYSSRLQFPPFILHWEAVQRQGTQIGLDWRRRRSDDGIVAAFHRDESWRDFVLNLWRSDNSRGKWLHYGPSAPGRWWCWWRCKCIRPDVRTSRWWCASSDGLLTGWQYPLRRPWATCGADGSVTVNCWLRAGPTLTIIGEYVVSMGIVMRFQIPVVFLATHE